MASPTPNSDPSKSAPSSPKKGHETRRESASGATATKTTDAFDAPVSPRKAKSYGDLLNTPSVKHGSIAAWGSTSGKLYLSDPRLDDPKSRSGLSDYFFGWAKGKNEATEQGDATKEKNADGEEKGNDVE
ncbi:uncharacterized protein A1O5_03907 [Cladophialophora psammophila CBS 110553]|uniref:Uncharacterized protein n=1 Tax=Cladophialophora psammophila CBS 110553 TaxID=1182543 RepID=W9X5Z1_9EURO|nr:uncharacterized protein A1O5_03907 [Cladophialophora psammophila CBS 110553]EXJ72760.1 hypothetical protein A1O5_03907 [Cladophialophora psammophila CBS 110553]